MATRKRKALQTPRESEQLAAVVDAANGVSSIVSSLASMVHTRSAYSVSWTQRLAKDILYEFAEKLTAYGTVCETHRVGELEIYHVNPFALLAYACDSSHLFSEFFAGLVRLAAGQQLSIIYYLDKATPGNEKRPDNGRSAQCIYFSFLEFPAWFLSRRNGWIPFAYVKCEDQKEANITDSELVRFLVRCFGSSVSEHAFSRGFGVTGPRGTVTIVRANRQLMIADWDQHVRTFNLKGYNARVPCGICRNVLGRCRDFEDEYLVHIFTHEHQRFDKHTPESYADLADAVRLVAETEPHKLAQFEMNSGVKYNANGLLWDEEVREKFNLPMGEYPDWMHNMVASGGLAQYSVNGIVLFLNDTLNITPAEIDEWASTVQVPQGLTPLRKNFCSTPCRP